MFCQHNLQSKLNIWTATSLATTKGQESCSLGLYSPSKYLPPQNLIAGCLFVCL